MKSNLSHSTLFGTPTKTSPLNVLRALVTGSIFRYDKSISGEKWSNLNGSSRSVKKIGSSLLKANNTASSELPITILSYLRLTYHLKF